ncbi:hypothetical protein TNCT_144601 [Trichonephila clavata]|uniref:Uncharacterized protein n=1 Tax=Trichonephila clavata TaxID=2740835 RepID=A0A8X6K0M9_TRICU|nr:hypothetical protein TNCT_144601 [Trichonephila clavata]
MKVNERNVAGMFRSIFPDSAISGAGAVKEISNEEIFIRVTDWDFKDARGYMMKDNDSLVSNRTLRYQTHISNEGRVKGCVSKHIFLDFLRIRIDVFRLCGVYNDQLLFKGHINVHFSTRDR